MIKTLLPKKVTGNKRGNKNHIIQVVSLCQINLTKSHSFSLSVISPFYSSAFSMFIDSQPITGTGSVQM